MPGPYILTKYLKFGGEVDCGGVYNSVLRKIKKDQLSDRPRNSIILIMCRVHCTVRGHPASNLIKGFIHGSSLNAAVHVGAEAEGNLRTVQYTHIPRSLILIGSPRGVDSILVRKQLIGWRLCAGLSRPLLSAGALWWWVAQTDRFSLQFPLCYRLECLGLRCGRVLVFFWNFFCPPSKCEEYSASLYIIVLPSLSPREWGHSCAASVS